MRVKLEGSAVLFALALEVPVLFEFNTEKAFSQNYI
jgi:hypothetical protein